jgi:hypothetical protein
MVFACVCACVLLRVCVCANLLLEHIYIYLTLDTGAFISVQLLGGRLRRLRLAECLAGISLTELPQ